MTIQNSNKKVLNDLKKHFEISQAEMKRIIKDFHAEMEKGLRGEGSSLKMIPTFVDRPTGDEIGKFIALDLGGTNFRILELELKGVGRIARPVSKKFVIDKKHLAGKGEALFDFIAGCVKLFMKEKKMSAAGEFDLGFTFSFPIEQTGVASGTLLHWTKGFSAKGVIGQDVVKLLNEALARNGVNNVKVAALANDTVGTLVAKSYEDRDCDVAVILGTGTNACYAEDISNIGKPGGPGPGAGPAHETACGAGQMIINIEWGNFNKLALTPHDRRLDRGSENPCSQILEKMVSGMYLGELARMIIEDFIKRKMLFGGGHPGAFREKFSFKAEYMSVIESDRSKDLSKIICLFRKLGIRNSTLEDRQTCREICRIISLRAARISAASLVAVITKIDPTMMRNHTVAIDGSVYEKYPNFAERMKDAMRETLGRPVSRVKMVLAKDGSGKGAAIIAAVAR